MEYDLSPFYERCRADQQLFGLSRDHYGLKPPQRLRPFEALALAIASQPGSVHYFRASLSPVADRFSYNVAYAGHTFCAFPSAESIHAKKPEDLAKGSVTLQQAEQLHALAGAVVSGELDFKALTRRPLDTLLSELQNCKGIGPLGAQITALTGYGRLDCFPSADSALRRWVGRHVFDTDEVDEETAAQWSETWGDLRGVVAIYIYADLLRDELI
jgi:3-methyladenine DNA glycosylase/8-oxoguanine DNA glycosylase